MCLNHTVQKDSRGVLGTSFRFGPTSESLNLPKSYRPKAQPRSTRNEFPIRADFGNSRTHPIWRLKRGGKLTAKEAVLSPEKRDFTVLLTNFAFIVTFEEFLVLYSEQSFYKCLVPLAGITEENSTVQRDILNHGNICWHVHHLSLSLLNCVVELDFCRFLQA